MGRGPVNPGHQFGDAADWMPGGDRFLKYAEALPRADPDRQVNAVLIAIENRVRLSERIGQFMN